ncbi:pyridoxamine 5'-phosphate oxidase family protein [Candidatus Korarchaeum cryptofilum]|jgi:nitroimidazol reductase NimA-like FMN-containing flavoprotein (pyridoxamine 5'-phosphate oxidase superfamily)|uniref:Pyridoxamine 5'-phosphate oxidase-related FMN-binding n=1 Tax=Korarchaeum cryptofilum (strain OPF8) TaxID=374847 RepID=B1L3W3_KORCO|nr:pyridoxamine 5'-phosphate oxidase family protein [Candidatus Korarchaeum cryptofilum]ACB07142.1 pyridoxamine 5'-phosphate oxidase-related FMN-binding [Candidatus Korarchaeum cryptofilum OPF8]
MRRTDKEMKDGIEEVLRRAKICRIAMCDGGVPYCVPVIFCYSDGFIYIHSAREGRKIDILRRSSLVCFETEIDISLIRSGNPCKWTLAYKSVIGIGRASFVEDREEKRKALNCIIKKYSDEDFEISNEELDKVEVIRIEIEEMSGKRSP